MTSKIKGGWFVQKKKVVRERSKEEILRQIEWAENEHEKMGKNIPEHRRGICRTCGQLFDILWKRGNKKQERCAMCS